MALRLNLLFVYLFVVMQVGLSSLMAFWLLGLLGASLRLGSMAGLMF